MPVYLTVDKRSDGLMQMSIGDGNLGYRIAGPKYDGTSKTVLQRELTLRDKKEIESFLRTIKG